MMKGMFILRSSHIDHGPAVDGGEDRDLIALVNEARDPQELERITRMGRDRQRARDRAADRPARPARSRGARFSLGRRPLLARARAQLPRVDPR
jgi:hypothetical protein